MYSPTTSHRPTDLAPTDTPPPVIQVVLIANTPLAHRKLSLITWMVRVVVLIICYLALTHDPLFGLCLLCFSGILRDLVRGLK